MEAIYITGQGMVTSLAHDVITCCAAARAGITKSVELDYYQVCSSEDGSIGGLVGHAVPILTEGFEGDARLLRLTAAALSDLQRQTPHAPWEKAKIGFYLSLAHPRRVYTAIDLIADEVERKGKQVEAQEEEQTPIDENRPSSLLENAARLSGWQGKAELRFAATSGNTGVAEACHKAIEDLAAGKIEAAVVGGVDSLLEEDTLAWLENTGRLKTPAVPAGLQPGEAGAFIVLETMGGANSRRAKALGVIESVHLGKETRTLLSGGPPLGTGLEEVIRRIADNPGFEGQYPVWFITDQNGEPYRAAEWGNAIVRLVAHSPIFSEPIQWYPSMSFGDTGAASGAISICMALSAFERNYAPAQTVIVLSSGEGELRAGFVIKTPFHRHKE